MTFQEFPLETKKSIRNLFWKASNSDTSSAMDLIEKNIQKSNEFVSDMDIVIQVFQYSNIFEGSNLIFEFKRNIKVNGRLQ